MKHHAGWLLLVLLLTAATTASAADRDPLNMNYLGSWPAGSGEAIALHPDFVLGGEGGLLRVFQRQYNGFGVEIGELAMDGMIHQIVVDDDLVYLAVREVGLVVVALADDGRPSVLTVLELPGGGLSVDLAGGLAAVGGDRLYLVDASDPASLVLLASIPFAAVAGVDLDGDRCHVADVEQGYALVDVADPDAPVVLGIHTAAGGLETVTAAGTLVYAGTLGDGIVVLDVTDPVSIAQVGAAGTGHVRSLATAEGLLYSSGPHLLRIFSLAVPTQPSPLGEVVYSGGNSVAVGGQYVYVANDYSRGFAAVNCSNLWLPTVREWRDVRTRINRVDVDGAIAMITSVRDYIVLDVTDPTRPTPLAEFATTPYPNAVIVEGDLAYCHSAYMLGIYDLTDPSAPTILGHVNSPEGDDAVKVDDAILACVSTGLAGRFVRVYDVADPSAPHELLMLPLPTTMQTTENVHLVTRGDLLLVHAFHSGAWLLDVSAPFEPELLSSIPPENTDPLSGAAIGNGYLYLQYYYGNELRIYDIADPTDPQLAAVHPNMPGSVNLVVQGDLLLSAGGDGGVFVFDISEPLQPILAAAFDTQDNARDLILVDDVVYVADGRMGLQVLSLNLGPVATLTDGLRLTTVDGTRHELTWRYRHVVPDHQRLTADYARPDGPTIRRKLAIRDDGGDRMAATDASSELAACTSVRYVLWSSVNGVSWQPVAERESGAPAAPGRVVLHPAYPNPCNPSTSLAFDLAFPAAVRLDIVDASGRVVRRLVSGNLTPGRHEVVWNGRDDAGRRLASGVYLSHLVADMRTLTGKLMLLQ